MWQYFTTVAILLFTSAFIEFPSFLDAKRGSSSRGSHSRGFGRGQSSSRGNRPVAAAGHNRPYGGNPAGSHQSYGSSVGTSSSSGGFLQGRTSQLVAAGLVGAALGAGTYGLISAANSHYTSPENGRTYYMGEKYYPGKPSSGRFLCKYPISENDTKFGDLHYDNSTRVKEIFYECKINEEVCCKGLDCCKVQKPQIIYIKKEDKPVSTPWWSVLLIGSLSLSLMCCVGYFVYVNIKKYDDDVQNTNQFEPTYDINYQTTTNDQLQPQPPYHQTGPYYQGQQGFGGGASGYYNPPPHDSQANYPPTSAPYSSGNYYQQTPASYPGSSQPPNYPPGPPTSQTYGFNVPQSYPSIPK